nr:MAG TPA: Pyocin activator protein PrtN [Caudoviricetes sp.]
MTSIPELAKITGYSAENLRNLIKSGKLPIAVTLGTDKKSYCLLPPKVYEYLGIKIDGYEPPPTVNIDYSKLVTDVAGELANRFAGKEQQ